MPTLRSASLCAFSAIILFSCSTKTKNKIADKDLPVMGSQSVQVLPKETLDIAALQKKFVDAATQHFSVSSKRVSVLNSRGGLKLTVDPAALEKENGKRIEGNINVSIIEVSNVNDLFRCNAATVSDGRLLASGGSYFIGMENGGEKIRIKNGETIEVALPRLKKDDMELFYGERNGSDDMNWKAANVSFKQQYETISFSGKGVTDPATNSLSEISQPRIYKGLDEAVYYYNKRMTVLNLVNLLNKNEPKVYLQTISYWPKNLPTDRVLDTNHLVKLYGPRKQYILKTYKQDQQRKAELEKWQPKTLAGQIQKNYAPTALTSLGWINCDRFYNAPENVETEVQMPYTFNNSRIEYFILFKRFNGLINGRADIDESPKLKLADMPKGEDITLIAFTKKNGKIYQAKEDYVIGKNKTLSVNFKEISAADMNKLFGSNVKI
ncbi:MAG: hypothetical protein QM737_11600 [Ferruginibacter sp.]